jgi:hypothetical protein
MNLDYQIPGVVKIDMVNYVKDMIDDFPEEVQETICPWNGNLFKVDTNSPNLSEEKEDIFHTLVAKGLFLCKRARSNIQPAITFLTTHVKGPNQDDWFKLKKSFGFLKSNKMRRYDLGIITWHVDAAFTVHPDFRRHTGTNMTLGNGALQSMSTKQKVNCRSSTKAELAAMDDVIAKVLWTKQFLEAQGYKIIQNIVLRDNQSTMKLEQNGKASSGKRTQHFNIKFFYITDLID